MFWTYFFERSYIVSKQEKPNFYSRMTKTCIKRKRDFPTAESQQKLEIVENSEWHTAASKEVSFREQVKIYDRSGRVYFKRLKVDDTPQYFKKKSVKIELNLKFPFKSRAKFDNTYYYYTKETEFVSQEAELTDDESLEGDNVKGEEIESSGSFESRNITSIENQSSPEGPEELSKLRIS